MNRRTRLLKDILWVLAFSGLVAGVLRMGFGLGATTHLSDAVPWGLWKILNMVAGVALSTCGFTVGFLAVVLRIERFRPLLKPAILVAFLGYGSSCAALAFDIGLPDRFWHPLVMWNPNSFLFEVFWCVMLYFTVTVVELLPTVFERLRAHRSERWLHAFSFGVVVVGISLSSLHHSSLGSLFLVSPQRLHALWYSPMLPVFFILSAMGGGMMFLVAVRLLHARLYAPEPELDESGATCCTGARSKLGSLADLPALGTLACIGAGLLGLELILKLGDLLAGGAWAELLAGSWESGLFLLELGVGCALPLALVLIPRVRRSPAGLAAAAVAGAGGLVLNRLNVGIFGYFADAGEVYFPSLAEWAVSLGVVAAAGLAFLFAAENLSIFDERWRAARSERGRFRASFDSFSQVWDAALTNGLHRVSLIALVVLPAAFVLLYPGYQGRAEVVVRPPSGIDATRASLRIDGDRAGVAAIFPHADHQQRLGGERSCATCHHLSLPGDRSTPCSRCHREMLGETSIFDHFAHMEYVASSRELGGLHPANHSCDSCHAETGPRSRSTASACIECHREDMLPAGGPEAFPARLRPAISFQRAMHLGCIPCHEKAAREQDRPGLAECGNCHPSRSTSVKRPVRYTRADAER